MDRLAWRGGGPARGPNGQNRGVLNGVCCVLRPAEEAKRQVEATNSIPVAAARFASLIEKTVAIKKRRPFRLLCDLRWMKIGVAGGAEQMAHELLSAVAHLDHRNHYRLFCPRSTFHEWNFPSEFQVRGVFSDPEATTSERLGAAITNRLAESLRPY